MKTEDLIIDSYERKPLPTARDIVAILFRQRRAMLIASIVAAAALTLSGAWVPKYEAKMKILVLRQRSDAIVTSSANEPAQFTGDQVSEEDLNSEVELLNSEDLLRKVVLTTGLNGKQGGAGANNSEASLQKAVHSLAKDLTIEPLRKSNVISVAYTNRDARLAAQVLQALAAAYTEKHLELHRASGEFKFFDHEMRQYQQGLLEAQAKLTEFTKSTGIVSTQIERDSALEQANEFESTARRSQAAIVETEHRVQTLQSELESTQPRVTTVLRTSDNPQLLQQLKSTLLNLQLKRTELLTKYEPTYRLVQEADRQIADAKSAIAAEETKPIREETSDENPNYQWVLAELAKARADLGALKARAASAASISSEYRRSAERLDRDGMIQQDLQQAAKTQEANYLLYVGKREEARISDALDQGGILNVAMAELPVAPSQPRRSPASVAVLMLLLAGSFSISAAFAADFMDQSFRTPDELAGYLGMPVLAALPKGGE